MEITDVRVEVTEASGVGEARRVATEVARRLGFGETDRGRTALIVTEAATNMVKHAGGGEFLIRPVRGTPDGLDLVALDRGHGIADLAGALRDGFSSAGTPGNGLGAMARTATLFDLYSRRGLGTAVFARVSAAAAPTPDAVALGVVNMPYPGEIVCGDAWAMRRRGGQTFLLVVDGLGHGQAAHDAARVAESTFHAETPESPATVLESIHHALRPTRGAAVAVAEIDSGRRRLRFAGLGNIAGTIIDNGATRSIVSHHGTAGHDARRIQEFTYPWSARASLILHSDGLTSRWTLDAYPGLLERHPMLAAALLYRDFRRGRDDATVLVVREAA